jgi:hypothetical protein
MERRRTRSKEVAFSGVFLSYSLDMLSHWLVDIYNDLESNKVLYV